MGQKKYTNIWLTTSKLPMIKKETHMDVYCVT